MKFQLTKKPTIDLLISKLKKKRKLSSGDEKFIRKAYSFAEKYHKGQKRKTGEPYIIHPLITAYYLEELGMDNATIVSGLLHDVPEDTSCTLEDIKKEFGEDVAEIVDGVTRLGGVKYFGKRGKAEDLRKLLLIMAKDLRVVVVKLMDRLHNMQTLEALPTLKRKKIAQETIDIYAPLASRLGMGEIKGILEDLSFKYYLPKEYKKINFLVTEDDTAREAYMGKVISHLKKKLKDEKIKAVIEGRAKHLYSLFKKLKKHNNDISKIYDLVAIRIIVNNISDCYRVLGLIHEEWKPLIKRIKDYISVPKPNGYRSIHTTVFSIDGKIVEIQIKTQKMHEEAEWGIAAHWHYKERGKSGKISQNLGWINKLLAWQKELESSAFMEGFRVDVFKDRIFVFTPRGEAVDLPEGATPIDFAYGIHTEIGNSCVGAKVNGRLVPLSHSLKNGDLIEIITSKRSLGPSRDWLRFAKTPNALHEIRKRLRKESTERNIEIGRDLLNEELKKIGKSVDKISRKDIKRFKANSTYQDLDSILTAVGAGYISSRKVASDLYLDQEKIEEDKGFLGKIIPIFRNRPKKESRIVVSGEDNLLTKIATCCSPKEGDEILGYITRGSGITIHKKNCPNIAKQDKKRLISAKWASNKVYFVSLYIEANKGSRILNDLTKLFSKLNINTRNFTLKTNNVSRITVDIEVSGSVELREIIEKISDLDEILLVKKV